MIVAMGIDENTPRRKTGDSKSPAKAKSVDPKQTASVKDFFRVVPRDKEVVESEDVKPKKSKPHK